MKTKTGRILSAFSLALLTNMLWAQLTPTTKLPSQFTPVVLCDPFSGNALNGTPYSVNPPFGPGNRTMRVCINKCNFSSTNPPELVVFYSRTESLLSNVSVNSTASYGHGKARFTKVAGDFLVYEYTFPHSGFTDLNGSGAEFKIIEMPSRDLNKNPAKIFYRLGVRPAGSTVLNTNGGTESFTMPDPLTIAIVGDSYIAGEGAPLVSARSAGGDVILGVQTTIHANMQQMWNDNDPDTETDIPCHRSLNSGAAQAAAQIRLNNKKTAIAIKFVACSGAKTGDLMSSHQNANNVSVPPQFDMIQDWLNKKGFDNLDILLMGIGGNDVGFAPLIIDFLITPIRDFSSDEDAKRRYSDPNDGRYPWKILANNYDALERNIGERFGVLDYNVIVMSGPSMLKGPVGNPWCGEELALNAVQVPGDCWGFLEEDDRPAEFRDLHTIVATKLNSSISEAAERNKWTFVSMLDKAGNHGLSNCAEPYYNTLGQAIANQGDEKGTCHPNANGFQMYKTPVGNALQARIDAIKQFWGTESADCGKEAYEAAKQQAIEAAKARAIARARAKASPAQQSAYTQSYEQFSQLKFGDARNEAIRDFEKKIKTGAVKLPAPNVNLNVPGQLKNINLQDQFQK